MILAIVGSRDYPLPDLVDRYLENAPPGIVTMVINGGSGLIDLRAISVAKRLGYPTDEIFAEWNLYGKPAGPMRNRKVVDRCHQLTAFWNERRVGIGAGTFNAIGLAYQAGKLRRVFGADGKEIRWP